jgi:hypothetical protein
MSGIRGDEFNGGVRAGIRTRRKRMKQVGFLTLLIMATLLLTLAFPVGAASPKAAAVAAAAPASPAAAAPAMPPHPRVENAIAAMRTARDHMVHAEGAFHGHRDKAIEHLDAAIHEAEICLGEP